MYKKQLLSLIIVIYGITNTQADTLSILSSQLISLEHHYSLIKSPAIPSHQAIKPSKPTKSESQLPTITTPSAETELPRISKPSPAPTPTPTPSISTIAKVTGPLKRSEFFKDIVDMSEDTFRINFDWEKVAGKPYGFLKARPDKDEAHKLAWIQQYPRRAAIFQGKFSMHTPAQLLNTVHNAEALSKEPYFRIIIHNPGNPQQTDIRALQADPQLKYANFQLASTFFGPLEGGMYRYEGELEEMLKFAVQGEEASISAAPATIFRKYFMKPKYLLENLKDKFIVRSGKFGQYIDGKNYEYDKDDIDQISIGIHQNIAVSSGYGQALTGRRPGLPGSNDTQDRLEIEVKDGMVDTNKSQIIHQIFTSAYDLGKAYNEYGSSLPQNITQAARMILSGMYKATIMAPFITKNPVIYLTLLGAGAFRNDPQWIYEALYPLRKFIKEAGLQVTLIYRPDVGKQTRGAKVDLDFLNNLFKVADYVNDSNLTQDSDFKAYLLNYLNAAYSNDRGAQINYAQELNSTINNTLPSYAPKISLQLTQIQSSAGKPQIEISTTKAFQLIKKLNDSNDLGWFTVGNDAVLVNLRQATHAPSSPNNYNYIYVTPNFPGQALPNGLYYWESQGFSDSDVGNRKKKFYVKNNPKGKDYVYDASKKAYVDSHHKDRVWDASKHKKDPQWNG